MNTLIHLLIVATMLGLGVCLVIMVKIINDMEIVLKKAEAQREMLTQNNLALFKRMQEMEREKQSEKAVRQSIADKLIAEMEERYKINVVGKDKPLDFPNDRS